jgi:hypothetical protein
VDAGQSSRQLACLQLYMALISALEALPLPLLKKNGQLMLRLMQMGTRLHSQGLASAPQIEPELAMT